MKIHFICRANVLRSLIAETYLRSLNIPNITVASSGTEAEFFKKTIEPYLLRTLSVLESHGLKEYIGPASNQLTQERIEDSDLIIVMSDKVHDDVSKLINLPKQKTMVWNIDDIEEGPLREELMKSGRIEEDIIYEEVTAKVDELVKSLRSQEHGR